MLVGQLLNMNKEFKSLEKLETQTCFVHDAAYSDSKDLIKRTVADKILKNRAFDTAKDPKYDVHQRGSASMVNKFFDSKVASPDKKSVGSGAKRINTKITPQNEQLTEELMIIFGVLI